MSSRKPFTGTRTIRPPEADRAERPRSPSSIELFAGAGGLAIGTAQAGFDEKVVIEWDENACRTLSRNATTVGRRGGRWAVVNVDVGEYDFRQHRDEIDFVSGGPPCQPFSIGGKHRGNADARNLFSQAILSHIGLTTFTL